jgi:hypothetical protein
VLQQARWSVPASESDHITRPAGAERYFLARGVSARTAASFSGATSLYTYFRKSSTTTGSTFSLRALSSTPGQVVQQSLLDFNLHFRLGLLAGEVPVIEGTAERI